MPWTLISYSINQSMMVTMPQSILATWIAVLINISNIFHRNSKHRIFGPIKTNWLHVIPSALLVNVDIHCTPNFTIPVKILRGSNNYVLPPKNIMKGRSGNDCLKCQQAPGNYNQCRLQDHTNTTTYILPTYILKIRDKPRKTVTLAIQRQFLKSEPQYRRSARICFSITISSWHWELPSPVHTDVVTTSYFL